MGQDPDVIKEQIEQVRERMGETVDALGYKADVPARTRDSISGRVEAVKAKVTGAASGVSDSAPDAHDVKQAGRQAVGVVQENPLGLAVGAAAVGFLAGMLIPSTKIEDERIGPVADQVKEQARQTGQEALEHGKQIAQETVQTAGEKAQQVAMETKEQVQSTAQHHAEELKASAQDSVQEVKQTAQE